MKLDGKVAIVTGAARGIGKGIAVKFASEGAAVVVADVLVEQAQETADEIKKQGGKAIAVKTDVASRADVNNLIKSTLENFKAVHILVNNAGIQRDVRIIDMTEEDWDVVLDVDLKGVFNCTQAVLGHMMEQRYGKIINVASGAGLGVTLPGNASYSAAKAGVIQLTKVTAMEAGPYGINVNAIAPGFVRTDLIYTWKKAEEVEGFIEMRAKQAMLGRTATPEDIANLALFLASDDSSFMTGHTTICDGGRHDYVA